MADFYTKQGTNIDVERAVDRDSLCERDLYHEICRLGASSGCVIVSILDLVTDADQFHEVRDGARWIV